MKIKYHFTSLLNLNKRRNLDSLKCPQSIKTYTKKSYTEFVPRISTEKFPMYSLLSELFSRGQHYGGRKRMFRRIAIVAGNFSPRESNSFLLLS